MDTSTIALMGGVAAAALTGIGLTFHIMSLRRVVPTNTVHVVQSGKKTTSYGKGSEAGNSYYEWHSWIPVIGVVVADYPMYVFNVSLKDYEAYDSGRLPFVVDITAFFRIANSDMAAQRVSSFHELQLQLTAVLQGTVRRVLGTNKLEDIMQDRSKLADDFTAEVKEQLTEWGVEPVKAVEFMDIRDTAGSSVIRNIMAKEQSRIDMESRLQVADNKRTAELREIDTQREVEVQRQDAAQQIGIRTALKDQTVGIADERSAQEILLARTLTTQREMDVKQIEEVKTAEIARSVAVVRADQDKSVTIVKAEADQRKMEIDADAKRKQIDIVSQGELAAARNSAEGLKAEGAAKAEAERLFLMAPVSAQIELAEKIGANEGYQRHLQSIRNIEAQQAIGVEQAKALSEAEIKIIANGGDVASGFGSVSELFSSKGGTALSGFIAGVAGTPEGAAVIEAVTGATKKGKASSKPAAG